MERDVKFERSADLFEGPIKKLGYKVVKIEIEKKRDESVPKREIELRGL